MNMIMMMKWWSKRRRGRKRRRFIHTAYLCIASCSCHWPVELRIRSLEDSALLTQLSCSSSLLLSSTHNPLSGACCPNKWPDIHYNLSSQCTIQKNLKGPYINLFHFYSSLEDFFFFYTRVITKANWSFSANISPVICYFSFFHDCETEKEDNFLYSKRRFSGYPGVKAKRRKHKIISI